MTFLTRLSSICSKDSRHRCIKLAQTNTVEYKVNFLDGRDASFHLPKSALGSDLINQVVHHLNIMERDYFSLKYHDKKNNIIWLNSAKKLDHITKHMKAPYVFNFHVKFYASDPDELKEELTRYHFFLECREEIKNKKLTFDDPTMTKLAALSVQSEVGNFVDIINPPEKYGQFIFFDNPSKELIENVQNRHKQLSGYTPGRCEIDFLKIVKKNDNYGIESYNVMENSNLSTILSFTPFGLTVSRAEKRIGLYNWNTIKYVSVRHKSVHFVFQGKVGPQSINQHKFNAANAAVAKNIWKMTLDYYMFSKLNTILKNADAANFGAHRSNFSFNGEIRIDALEKTKPPKPKPSIRRICKKTFYTTATAGYIRIGSRVLMREDDGGYIKALVINLSDHIFALCDDGNTLTHPINVREGIVSDTSTDESDLVNGTKVLVLRQKTIKFFPGVVTSTENRDGVTKYRISFEDGIITWHTIDEIRLMKLPVYFGPGSYTNYLKNNLDMIKDNEEASVKVETKESLETETFTDLYTQKMSIDKEDEYIITKSDMVSNYPGKKSTSHVKTVHRCQ